MLATQVNNIAKHVDMSTKLQTVIKYCVVLIVIVHWTACALKLVTEYTLNECDYEDCPQTILTSTSNYRDGIWAQYVEAAVWALVAINGEASTRTHGEGVLGLARCLVSWIWGSLFRVWGHSVRTGSLKDQRPPIFIIDGDEFKTPRSHSYQTQAS